MLILYIIFRDETYVVHKTFGGIIKLSSCIEQAITAAIKDFFTLNKLDMIKMVMFTSVMLGKNNGVATHLVQCIPHLIEQHFCGPLRRFGISHYRSIKFKCEYLASAG